MDLHTLRGEPHLSVSGIADYLDCGLLYKLGRVDKLTPEFKAEALVFGTAIHAALAEFYQSRLEGEQMSAKQLEQSFEQHWHRLAQDREDLQYKPDKDYQTLRLEGKELLSIYYHQLPPEEGRIIGIEAPFSFNLDGLPIPLIGACDLVMEDDTGVITIVDHKTSSRAYSISEVDKSLQLTVYQLAARAQGYDDREILLRVDCLIKTQKPKFEQYYTVRSEVEEKQAIRLIQEVYQGISREVFIPHLGSWKCAGCPYQAACAAWLQGGEK